MWADYEHDSAEAMGNWLCDPCYQRLHGNDAHDPDVHEWLESQPTREEWLQRRLYDTVRPIVETAGHTMPAIRVGCGWSGSGFEHCTLGVCYDKAGSAAGYYEIFVSPTLDKPVDVVSVMFHETAHAIAGCKHDHDEEHYGAVAQSLGLTQGGPDGKGPWPTTAYPGADLRAMLDTAAETWEPYPHAALNPPPPTQAGGGKGSGTGGSEQKQTTRLLKAACKGCGYTIRLTMKWAQRGLPTCVCGCHFSMEQS